VTAQICEEFLYQEQAYVLIDVSNRIDDALFDPAASGLSPYPSTMACWRGYKAVFSVVEGKLVLDKLHINLRRLVDGKSKSQKGLPINGVNPISTAIGNGRLDMLFNNHYEDLALPITYNGGLLLGQDWIPGRDGYYPFWRYETVLELIFEEGVFQAYFDRSQDLADFQVQYKAWRAGKREEMPDRTQVREIMNRSFAFTYKY